MDPPLICFNKLQTSIKNSCVDIFGEKKIDYQLLDFFEKKGVENASKKAITLQLHGGFPAIMDQYNLEHFCTIYCDLSTM